MPRLVIPGRLPGLNDAFAAARAYGRNPKANPEARLRKQYEGQIILIAKGQLKRWRAHGKVRLRYTFYEKNRCRDMDNVAGYAHKLIQDALVKGGFLADDGWNYVAGYTDDFAVDKRNPRIELEIEEVG